MTLSPARTALIVLAVCFAIGVVARGVGETYALFLLPLSAEFGWDRASLTGVYSVYMLVYGLGSPVAGYIFDRYGPRAVYGIGFLCMSGGVFLAAHLQQLWQFYLCVGVLGGFGIASMGMVPTSVLISRWFRERLSTAMGIAYSAMGIGMILILPLTQWMIEQAGWRSAYWWLGIGMLLLWPLVLLLPWRTFAAGHPDYARPARDDDTGAGGWTLRQAVRSRAFWWLGSFFFFTAVSIYLVLLQAVAYMVEVGFDPIVAATLFGFTGLLSVVGMVVTAWLADRFGGRRVVTVSFSFTLTGILMLYLLAFFPMIGIAVGFVVCFGGTTGSRGPVISTMAARLFPGRGLGTIFGTLTMGMGAGAAIGTWTSGALYDLTGGYVAGFVFAVTGVLLALGSCWMIPDRAAQG